LNLGFGVWGFVHAALSACASCERRGRVGDTHRVGVIVVCVSSWTSKV
jgi:hypothetical protein